MANQTATTQLTRNAELRRTWLALNQEALHAEAAEAEILGRGALDESAVAQATRYRIQARRARSRRELIATDFCRENKGLAMTAAKSFFTHGTRSNHDDYVAAGEMGLWEAFLKWDPDQSTFGNFSRPYIEGRVRRCVHSMEEEGRSYGDWSAKPLIRAEEARLHDKHGVTPTAEEIAAAAGVTKDLVERARMARPVSLDAPVGDGESKLSDLVAGGHDPDEFGDDAFDLSAGGLDLDDDNVAELLAALSPIELMTIINREGVAGADEQTLLEIGNMIGRGRESIRHHEERGHKKIKAAVAARA